MNTQIPLLASYWTMAGGAEPHTDHEYSPFNFLDRVAAIAAAGFQGMGLWHADLEHVLRSFSLKDMKKILDDHGIKHVELEFLSDWFLDGQPKLASDRCRKLLLTAAEALGAHHVKVGDFANTSVAMPKLIESFSLLCKSAADFGTNIGFELMPFAMITTLEETLQLLEGANAPNGGVVIDLWHMVKLGIPFEKVAGIPQRFIMGVEVNDGYLTSPYELVVETTQHRLLCGEGEFDVRGFVKAMRQGGYQGPWGIEVLNGELRKRPLVETAEAAFKTTAAHFD